jgi:hypothetical protein
MLTPYVGGVVAAATLGASTAETTTLLAAVKDLELSRLGRLVELSHIDAPEPLPDLAIAEVAGWCDALLETGDRVAALGRIVALVGETYRHRGWAVLAAGIGAGDRVTALPPFDELVPAVSRWFDAALADAAVAALDDVPDARALATLAALADAPPPGRPLVATLETLARAIVDVPVAAALAEQITAEWSWDAAIAWTAADPTAWAKAIARAHGHGRWIGAIEDARAAIAVELASVLAATWQGAVGAARAAIPAASEDPIVAAIAELADRAYVTAATRIAAAARDGSPSIGALCAQLVGDPRTVDTWQVAMPAVLAALAGLDRSEAR